MPKQLALDFNRDRIRAVEIDGSPKHPRIRAFGSKEILPAGVGEDPEELEAEALAGLIRSQHFTKDPAACAMGSRNCTFREFDLPFTTDDQIRKVIKYEAESHLHLVDIDDVVVDYLKLRESRDGAHLLVMAYEKAVIEGRLGQMDRAGVDPLFADLHLTSVHRALEAAGYFDAVEVEGDAGDEDEAPQSADDLVLVLECDTDVSHLLVVHHGQLLAARAIPVGVVEQRIATIPDAPPDLESDEEREARNEDAEFVLVDEGDGIADAEQFFRRLRREVQRSLFPLGLAEESPRLLVLGPSVRDEGFVSQVGEELGMLAEVARPFDQFDHDLDPEILELANAEGVAALGVGLRLLSGELGVDFRQEEVRYAKRFDQLKVALSCAIIMALITAFLFTLVDVKKYLVLTENTQAAAAKAAGQFLDSRALMVDLSDEELNFEDIDRLNRNYRSEQVDSYQYVRGVRNELKKKHEWLGSRLGRTGGIPAIPSGLDVLKEVISAIETNRESIGRIEINDFDMDMRPNEPMITLQGWVNEPRLSDILTNALRDCPVVEGVTQPTLEPNEETGLIKFTGLKVALKPEFGVYERRGGRR